MAKRATKVSVGSREAPASADIGEPSLKDRRQALIVPGTQPIERIPSRLITPGERYQNPIRAILAVATAEGMRAVAGGLPLDDSIKIVLAKLEALKAKYASPDRSSIHNYGASSGEVALRTEGVTFLQRKGLPIANGDISEITISSAATPANAALAEAALPVPGGISIVEGPSYPGAIAAIWRRYPKFKQIRVDNEGPLPDGLRAALQDAVEDTNKPNVYWYTLQTGATFGSTASQRRRQEYVEIIKEYAPLLEGRLTIGEDDPYSDINMSGKPTPKSLTGMLMEAGLGEVAAYIGTFSKRLYPDAKMAINRIPKRLWAAYHEAIEAIELFPPRDIQLALSELMYSGDFYDHIDQLGEIYAPHRDVMAQSLARNAEVAEWDWNFPEFGMVTGVQLRTVDGEEPIDTDAIFGDVVSSRRTAYVPGKRLFVNEDPSGVQSATMRVSFSYPPEIIVYAIDAIADYIREKRQAQRARR